MNSSLKSLAKSQPVTLKLTPISRIFSRGVPSIELTHPKRKHLKETRLLLLKNRAQNALQPNENPLLPLTSWTNGQTIPTE